MKTKEEQNSSFTELVAAPAFDFKKGDVISFWDEQYFVIENNGSTGVVNPFGVTYYILFFQWQYQDSIAKFVRKPTKEELARLGL